MENELSKLLYDKYFDLTHRSISITLKSGREVCGVFISFFRGENYAKSTYITKWHLVDEIYSLSLGIDAFGFLIGEYIMQNDIAEIRFHQDNSIMKFNQNS